MATITPTVERYLDGDDAIVRITWTPLANGDDGSPVKDRMQFVDYSVQVFGTFGAGGTVRWEGTNDDLTTNFTTLTDPQGNSLALTSASIKQVMEITKQRRPRVSAGDGTTAITVVMVARCPQPIRV